MTDDGDPTTKSIGDSGSKDSSSSAKNTTPAMTLSPPGSTSTSPTLTSPMSTSARPSDASSFAKLPNNGKSLRIFMLLSLKV